MTNYRSPVTRIRFASGVNVLLGSCLLLSPWILGYISTDSDGALGSVSVGALMAILGLVRVWSPRRMPYLSGINVVLGFWTLISPWVYGFTLEPARMWSNALIGLVVMLCAAWSTRMTVNVQREHPA